MFGVLWIDSMDDIESMGGIIYYFCFIFICVVFCC